MATSVLLTYSAESGQAINAGRFAGGRLSSAVGLADALPGGGLSSAPSVLSGGVTLADATLAGGLEGFYVPSWALAATARTWIAMPGNTLQSVDPDTSGTAAWKGASGLRGSITAWCGLSFDPTEGVAWSTALGGHSDYYGNGVFKWSINQETPAWSMVLAPSNLGSYTIGSGTASAYSDGRPRSSHSYNAPVYVPGYGPALAGLEGVAPDGSNGSRAVVVFNETTGAATFNAAPGTSGASTGVAACFDPTRGTAGSVWQRWQGTSKIQRWDVATNTWASSASQSAQAWAGQCSLALHPSGAYMLVGQGDNQGGSGAVRQTVAGGWAVFDCAAQTYHTPTFTGAPALGSPNVGGLWPGQCQPVWVPALGCFCAWDNDSSRTSIITITPPASNPTTNAWTLGTLSVDGSNAVTPSAAQAAGTYGRFFWWPDAGGFVLLNDWNETGYFFKV